MCGYRSRANVASGSAYLRSMDTDTPIFFAFILKLYHTINQGEERVVSYDTDIVPRFECRSTLSHQNAAGTHRLAGKALHPEAFADAIAAVRRAWPRGAFSRRGVGECRTGPAAWWLGPRFEWLSGGVLLSHPVPGAVPSALRGLASGFGM